MIPSETFRSTFRHMNVFVLLSLSFLMIRSAQGHGLGVFSIDLGSEYLKMALVKPGVPMEIIYNKESQRKTPVAIAFRNEERLFGDSAIVASIKKPDCAYLYLMTIIGRLFESPEVQLYRERFPFHNLERDLERGTVLFRKDEDTVFSPEELIGMILSNSRAVASEFAEIPLKDVVITVPPFFNQAQRKAVLFAAQLAELNVLQLMSDNSAAALQFGVFRRAEFNATPNFYMFFDMGASYAMATIVEYRTAQVKEGEKAEMVPQLTVKGVGYARTLGGLEMDFRLRHHLLKEFIAQGKAKGNIETSPRSMAKLLKESRRLKVVLSANTAHKSQVEGLFEDIDFSTEVSRETLEDLCSDLFGQVKDVISDVLKNADMIMDEIQAIILVGGATRVPRIQEELLKATGKSELGKSLNTDEAIALGAVYQAAALGQGFKVKRFNVKEANIFPIEVSFERRLTPDLPEGEPRVKTVMRTLFGASNPYPQKKVMTFNKLTRDFVFNVSYGGVDKMREKERRCLGPVDVMSVTVEGVSRALENNSDAVSKGVKAHFEMNHNGVLTLNSVESIFEKEIEEVVEVVEEEKSTFSKISDTISSFFSSSDSESKPEPESDSKTVDESNSQTDSKLESEPEAETETNRDDNVEPETKQESENVDETSQSKDVEDSPKEQESSERVVEEDEEQREEPTSDDEPPADQETRDGTPVDKVEDTPSDTPTDAPSDTPTTTPESPKDVPSDIPKSTDTPDTPADTPTDTPTDKPTEVKKVKTTVSVPLEKKVDFKDVPLPTKEAKEASRKKLREFQKKDEERRLNAEARNALESFIYETKDFLYTEDAVALTTEEERNTLFEVLNQASDWMFEDGDTAETSVLKDKLKELRKSTEYLYTRHSESTSRPKAVQTLRESLNVSWVFIERIDNISLVQPSDDQVFTKVERDSLYQLTYDTEKWLNATEAKQNSLPSTADPVLLVEDVKEKLSKLDREIMYLLNKLKYYRPKPKPAVNATNTSTNTTSDTSGAEKTVDEGTAKEDRGDTKGSSESPPESTEDTEVPLEVPLGKTGDGDGDGDDDDDGDDLTATDEFPTSPVPEDSPNKDTNEKEDSAPQEADSTHRENVDPSEPTEGLVDKEKHGEL